MYSEDEEEDEDEDEEEDEEDEEEEVIGGGASSGGDWASTLSETLWRSKEARARWLSALSATRSAPTVSLGLAALRAHTQLFAPLAERKLPASKREEHAGVLRCCYHAKALGQSDKTWAPKAGVGGKGVRFSDAEVRNLREGFRLFGGGRHGSTRWVKQTMERFTFHSCRTERALREKWAAMSNKK